MKIGKLIATALNLIDKVHDIPELSEEAENKIFKKIGEIVQIIIEDFTSE